ncbi:MAG: putative glycosyl transferase [Syntrophorhabdaceae bacterium PtaU1.Bin034]|nr:MAG: putative glycosyl transferase [Syntrophorhabdaceae bacterium PtaU1.Bin034]
MLSREKTVSKWSHSFRQFFSVDGRKIAKRACFVYYQHFNALLYREARSLQEQGFEVDIITLKQSRQEKLFHVYQGLNVYGIQSRLAAEKNLILYFLRLMLFYLKATALLTFLAPERRYDLVHVTAPPDIMVFAAFFPKLLGARIILDIHDIGPELFMRKMHVAEDQVIIRFLKFLERISARYADHVITVTDFWKDRLASRSVPPSKITMLLNVPDNELFKPVRSPVVRNSFNLYYHGSVEEHFGLDTLIKAMPLIKAKIPNALLHLYCGKKGRAYAECRSLAVKLNLRLCIIFHGGVPFYDLPHTLSNADIGVVPTKDSIFSNEAVSMKALEYISMGIPIVISRTKAHDFYYNTSMVKFFQPCNSEDLAQAVIELYYNAEEREQQVRNAEAFLKKHGWGKSKEAYAGVVNSLTRGR